MENLGLSEVQVKEAQLRYGKNELPAPERDAWYVVLLDKFKDPLIIVLLIAAAISGVLGIIEGSFIETIGIVCAILIATIVAFWSDLSSQKKFDALNSLNQAVKVMVKRAEGIQMIDQRDLVVGDIIILKQGDEIPADCVVIKSDNLLVNESSLTGESVPAHKGIGLVSTTAYPADFLLKSTIISDGSCEAKVTAVGIHTEIGKVAQESSLDLNEKTPLTLQLDELGDFITKLAFGIALSLFVLLTAVYIYNGYSQVEAVSLIESVNNTNALSICKDILQFLMIAITLVVVAVPEGLPMAVVISLSHSMKKLIKDNNLIKNLHACETMGAVSMIITDKTGTLTENKMVVSDMLYAEEDYDVFEESLIYNNSAEVNIHGEAIGNPTDAALLNNFIITERIIPHTVIHPFSSETKYMATELSNGYTYYKGAIEVIIKMCTKGFSLDFAEFAEKEASKGNRVIASACKYEDGEITFLGCVSIEDPIRKDVPDAIKECVNAGIKVVMATGDNEKTAAEIGRQAGISHVVSRCTPSKKVDIVTQGKNDNQVVAMLGDGTNDAPAMNIANIGVSVGSGTAIAKEASDVILMDDSFVSIVKGVKFGRSLYKNIQKFIIFQSTINVVAVVIAFLGQFFGVNIPLTVTQMLWVNLIMDTLAALALSTTSNDDVMSERPRNPKAFIINKIMAWDIILKGLAYIIILLSIIKTDLTEFFTIFVLLQWWNMFSCRVIGKGNIFKGLLRDKLFLLVSIVILVGQFLIVEFGGDVFRTEPMEIIRFLELLGLTALPFIFFEIIRKCGFVRS